MSGPREPKSVTQQRQKYLGERRTPHKPPQPQQQPQHSPQAQVNLDLSESEEKLMKTLEKELQLRPGSKENKALLKILLKLKPELNNPQQLKVFLNDKKNQFLMNLLHLMHRANQAGYKFKPGLVKKLLDLIRTPEASKNLPEFRTKVKEFVLELRKDPRVKQDAALKKTLDDYMEAFKKELAMGPAPEEDKLSDPQGVSATNMAIYGFDPSGRTFVGVVTQAVTNSSGIVLTAIVGTGAVDDVLEEAEALFTGGVNYDPDLSPEEKAAADLANKADPMDTQQELDAISAFENTVDSLLDALSSLSSAEEDRSQSHHKSPSSIPRLVPPWSSNKT